MVHIRLLAAAGQAIYQRDTAATAFADGPKIGPNGGARTDAGPYHAELVLKGNDVVLYVTDGSDKPVDVTGAKAEATLPAGSPESASAGNWVTSTCWAAGASWWSGQVRRGNQR